ncbi:MAG: phenylacetate-CoA oxygenase subunit PaaC [Rhodobacter sp.]|nr:phenylacetate-CoA oxygenase subunit PaaC [Rhodobacter sp.]
MTPQDLFQYLLRLGDNTLVLGHRTSEWCGTGPVLEEDIALANTALDLIGQTQMWLGYAGEVESEGRSADDLAMLRDVWDFRNVLLVEQPNGDFGQTMMRQFLFDLWHDLMLANLQKSADPRIAEIAEKASKEVRYHLERSTDTVVGLGDGSPESHRRMQAALNLLWPYVGELFVPDDIDAAAVAAGIGPDPAGIGAQYRNLADEVMARATLAIPSDPFAHKGGKSGFRHTEHLGHMLTEMQWLQRAYPGATW